MVEQKYSFSKLMCSYMFFFVNVNQVIKLVEFISCGLGLLKNLVHIKVSHRKTI